MKEERAPVQGDVNDGMLHACSLSGPSGLKSPGFGGSVHANILIHTDGFLGPPLRSVPAPHSSPAWSPFNTVLFYSADHHHSDASADRSTQRILKQELHRDRRTPGFLTVDVKCHF
ncbi:Hypothetical predicted protein [Xyrichtys novacula]|uniref:Uncharacterized protein n=1 Tax=Xyrichtys novacula TaxID=13765 RepID=A0AAV1HL77_XYRNO|nr:Hypothetical predicted protein [Xyrichtys novacula]